MRANIQALDGEWSRVSQVDPCPICGAGTDCRRHLDEAFVSCAHQPSEWRLQDGAWLHKLKTRRRHSAIRALAASGDGLDTTGPTTGVAS